MDGLTDGVNLLPVDVGQPFTIFNFAQAAAWGVDTTRGKSKYNRRVNFSDAVYFCCRVLRGGAL